MTQNILKTLGKLVSFKSVTPKSRGAIEYIAKLLEGNGFICDVQTFGKDDDATTNLYAKYGFEAPNVCFAGHVDVVPPMHQELWNYDPFILTIDGESVYGRGAVDMKGAIAVSLSAVIDFIKTHPNLRGSISFLLTSDEEGTGKYGTNAMLQYLANAGEKFDFTILGEPTSENYSGDTIKIGRRGSVNFDLTVTGKQGHVAYPQKAINPITKLIQIASNLINFKFGNEATNLEITSFDVGNEVVNITPETASLKFNIRFDDKHTSTSIIGIVMEIIAKHEVIFDLKYQASAESFMQKYTKQMQRFAKIVENECGIKPTISNSGGTSDARFIHKYSEVIEFGLNSNQAHKINEHTKISDLQTLYNVYYGALIEFLAC